MHKYSNTFEINSLYISKLEDKPAPKGKIILLYMVGILSILGLVILL